MTIIIRTMGMSMDWDETMPAISEAEASAIRSWTMTKSLLLIGFLRLAGSRSGRRDLMNLSDRTLLRAEMTPRTMAEPRAPMREKLRMYEEVSIWLGLRS